MEQEQLISGTDAEIEQQESGENVGRDCQNESSIHASLPNELIPHIGMEFDYEDQVFEFYNNYARQVGFSIRKSSFHKDASGKLLDRVFCCSSQGKRLVDKRDDDVICHRRETRFECKAMIKVSARNGEKLQVVKFVSKHTHSVVSPRKRIFLRSQRKVNDAQAVEVEMAEESGIAPKQGIGFMARRVGGLHNLGFIPDDYKNYLRTRRTEEMRVGDTGGILEYLQHMQCDDPNFSYFIQVDVDDLITNIFWADGLMKLDYAAFGDVVCFDTTYRKNKDGRPFALFVGVNHHKQSVIFGAALLYDETCDTFMWLFDTFAKVMSGKKPVTILTDQDAAMAKALTLQWPKTHHRLCIWHIYQNAAKHLCHVFQKFSNFADDFESCIYDHDEEKDFLGAWNIMIEKYGLQNNEWLQRLFELKEKWALVYGREHFCADMSSTQRSEGMNSQIKLYISYNCNMLRFFKHFERLVEDRRYAELKADYKAYHSQPSLPQQVEILKHAGKVYTPAIYKKFYNEMWRAWDCELHKDNDDGIMSHYKVIGKHHDHHRVTFDSSNTTITCSCNMFDFVGVLCSHALKVMLFHNIKRVPDKYILRRWTKEAKKDQAMNLDVCSVSNDPKKDVGNRYKVALRRLSHLAARSALTQDAFEILMSSIDNIMEQVESKLKNSSELECVNGSPQVGGQGDQMQKIKGIKPLVKSNKDRSSGRKKSALEKATGKKRRQPKESGEIQNSLSKANNTKKRPKIRKNSKEVVLDRAMEDVDVDIDLRREGHANKISRQQHDFSDSDINLTVGSNEGRNTDSTYFNLPATNLQNMTKEHNECLINPHTQDLSTLLSSSMYDVFRHGDLGSIIPTQDACGSFSEIYHPLQQIPAALAHPFGQKYHDMSSSIDILGLPTNFTGDKFSQN